MTKAVSNREICFIKALLLLCEHGHFKRKIENCVFYPPPPPPPPPPPSFFNSYLFSLLFFFFGVLLWTVCPWLNSNRKPSSNLNSLNEINPNQILNTYILFLFFMTAFLSLLYSFTSYAFNVKSKRKCAVYLHTDFLPYRMYPLLRYKIQLKYLIAKESRGVHKRSGLVG